MMKKLILALFASALVVPMMAADAQVMVQGYYRRDGTYVAPHYRSSPNNTTLDNYSTRGNVNPYTGRVGTRDPYYRPPSSTYSNPYGTRPTPPPCYYNCPN